ncbi:MAG: XapX domain-containing protein [Clostridia bacterium]|nr:XapX domain-containing protein [Clostridia bacterium]
MTEALLALLAGFAVGILFALLKLPLPAPPVLSGVLGIVGVYLGGKAFGVIQKYAVLVFNHMN